MLVTEEGLWTSTSIETIDVGPAALEVELEFAPLEERLSLGRLQPPRQATAPFTQHSVQPLHRLLFVLGIQDQVQSDKWGVWYLFPDGSFFCDPSICELGGWGEPWSQKEAWCRSWRYCRESQGRSPAAAAPSPAPRPGDQSRWYWGRTARTRRSVRRAVPTAALCRGLPLMGLSAGG